MTETGPPGPARDVVSPTVVRRGAPRSQVAAIDDHEVLIHGLASVLARHDDMVLVGGAASVSQLLAVSDPPDLVLLDLRLSDGSTATDNIARLHQAGAQVIAYTSGEDPALIREAARAGPVGMIRKSESTEFLLAGIRAAIRGETVASADWAAAIDGDAEVATAGLTPREEEVLALYASGEKADRVARALGISRETVLGHLKSIRTKYAVAQRPAPTKVDLYRRAMEDGLLRPPR